MIKLLFKTKKGQKEILDKAVQFFQENAEKILEEALNAFKDKSKIKISKKFF